MTVKPDRVSTISLRSAIFLFLILGGASECSALSRPGKLSLWAYNLALEL
jgi:hypothetical protein